MSPNPSITLSRAELQELTGTKQAKRMCDWLATRGWVHEAPARRGDIPKVDRDYYRARMSGQPLPGTKRAGPRLAFMLEPS